MSRRGRCWASISVATTTTDALNEAITLGLDGSLKLLVGGGGPVGAVGTRNGVVASEGDVKNIVSVVCGVSIDGIAEASLAQGE